MSAQVSVIIPTYNRRAMVREAIDSVLAQCGASLELIVVDDGSTDGSAEELSRLYGAQNMMRVERTANRGPAAARNFGATLAQAALIAFLDSDDLWSAGKLSRQLDFMRAKPDCEISQTNEIWIRDGRRVNPGARHRKRSGDFFVESIRTCLISPSAVMMRTTFFKSVGGFDESMKAAEDYDLWLRILIDREVGLLDEPLVTRRAAHRDQLSSSVPAIDRYRILALTKLLAADGLAIERRRAVAEVLAEKCEIYARGLKRRGRIEQARFYAEVGSNAQAKWLSGPTEAIIKTVEIMRAMLARDDNRHDNATASGAHEA
jgi:glycosyltransferase involved in cell wall biosynthesis